MSERLVQILMGSDSDAPTMQRAADVLGELGISSHMTVASAHRSPERVRRIIDEAPSHGVQVFIVGAGAAAHLAGVVAAHSTLPVIGVPIDSSPLQGWDAFWQLSRCRPAFRSRPSRSERLGRQTPLCWPLKSLPSVTPRLPRRWWGTRRRWQRRWRPQRRRWRAAPSSRGRTLVFKKHQEQRFLGVQAILCLVEYYRRRPVHHRVSDLFTTVAGRQCMKHASGFA